MRNILARVLATSLGLILATQLAMLNAADVAKGGTMVVAVRFKDGLVVCADKRSHLDGPGLPKENYRDDDVKITLVKETGGFVTAGFPILERSDGVRVFDADRVIGDHFREVGFAHFDQLAQRAEDAFRNYVLSKDPAERPPTQWREGQPVFFRAIVFFHGRKSIDLYDLELQYTNADPPVVHSTVQNRSHDRLRAYGTLVLKEIMGGKDKRFADLRKDDVLTSALRAGSASQVSEAQAISFAKKSIAVTSERIGLLDESLVTSFGPTSDCAVARRGTSIEWRPYGK
jgi:hypothetical protein